MTVRIGTVWDSTQQVLMGRAGMMVPFAAIGFVLPSVLQMLWMPTAPASQAQMGATALAVTIPAVLLGIWAQMAIMALATHPATTSADAARAGLRRLWPALGVALVIGIAFTLVVLVAIVALGFTPVNFAAVVAANGDPSKMPINSAAVSVLLLFALVVAVVSLWLAARFVLIYAVVLNERRGLGAIRRSIALTRGLTWRLIGVFLLFGVVMLVATMAVQSVTGAVFRLALGADRAVIAAHLAALLGSVVSAGFLTLAYVFVARLYVATAGEQAHREEAGSPSL